MADTERLPEGPYERLDTVTARYLRFIALGGGRDIREDIRMHAGKVVVGDLITDEHRELVSELAATGLPHESIARILKIAKSTLQDHFKYELETGFELAKANMSRTVIINATKMGDASAALRWLQLHPDSGWAEKRERTDREREADTDDGRRQIEAAQSMVNALIAGMSTAPALYRPPEQSGNGNAPAVVESKQRTPKPGATQRKAKGD